MLRTPMDGNLGPGRLRSALRARLQEMGPDWMTLAQGDLWRRRCVSGLVFFSEIMIATRNTHMV